jgi:protein-S-isoprenylcysteine O-methyltransferase Ste14
MIKVLRHLLSILLLPFVMSVLVPRWILAAERATDTRWTSGTAAAWIGGVAGAAVWLVGFGLFAWCVALFARIGQGTLAPWDPTQHLVAVGPYRHVRNPMISGVMMMLAGEALFTGSRALAIWAAIFLAFNHVYFLFVEEPGLVKRFGAEYLTYTSAVPRWVPRWTPWPGPSGS